MNEATLEQYVIGLIEERGYTHTQGEDLDRTHEDVLIKADLIAYLTQTYKAHALTQNEAERVFDELSALGDATSEGTLYEQNKKLCGWLSKGYTIQRDDPELPDLHLRFIHGDGDEGAHNIYRVVSQLTIENSDVTRIPDLVLYINGLPLVVIELKSAVREEATLHSAYVQLTTRYKRDIPKLFTYNAFCVISDGVNSKMGTLFSRYDFYYAWRKVTGEEEIAQEGVDSLVSMIEGLFDPQRLQRVAQHFIYFPDTSHSSVKVVCRYPQFYAANKLAESVKASIKPHGDGRGGTYFGATGCGKSYTMQFLARLLVKSPELNSPTLLLITDRTDLHEQLSKQMMNARDYLGDDIVEAVESRADLKTKLQGIQSGGVFLTTIQKFSEDTDLLTERSNVICISDEAHRSQTNLDQKITVTDEEVKKSYGFAYHLHQSLPNATFVGFTGTPVDATLDVFGNVVDAYTMTESVNDEITVRLVYEGRAAKVILDNQKLKEIEAYYARCEEEGSNEEQIEDSKRAMTQMRSILGDPQRIKALVEDFVDHYEARVSEGSTVKGKAMFVLSSRQVAWDVYRALKALRPQWFEERPSLEGEVLTEAEQRELKSMAMVNMVMTRNKDDEAELFSLLGDKARRQELDRQFKNLKSNFRIALVVDMWLTGFDVPALDTIYIDKPISKHNLIQTISRVNRRYEGKEKGLVVDYIGIKRAMDRALAHYSKTDARNFEDISASVVVVKDTLDLLKGMFNGFDQSPYFDGSPAEQVTCLKSGAEFMLSSEEKKSRFMRLVKTLKLAYDICVGSEDLSQAERDVLHFYLAVRSYLYKLTKGEAPDTAQMNAKVRQLIAEALASDGVEEVVKMGSGQGRFDLFDEDYLEKLKKVKLPHTKIKLLQKLLKQAIAEAGKTNRAKAINFSERFEALVRKYNERKEDSKLVSEVLEDFSDQIIDLYQELVKSMSDHEALGISFEEQAFYDILASLATKYQFTYPSEKLISLATEVKDVVDDKAKYTDWNVRDDIKAGLKVDLILLLHRWGYPPVDRDEVYQEIFQQAENFKRHQL